jgi:hypothetical protein
MKSFERRLGAAFVGWLLVVCLVHVACGAEPEQPMPPSLTPPAEYGCRLLGVVNAHTVSVQDLKRPIAFWVINVWFGKWAAYLPTRSTYKQAEKDCTKWRARIEAEAKKQQHQETERP